MGSSYRDDLNSGRMIHWEDRLRDAIACIQSVCDDLWECTGDDGQFDNAADDGVLRSKLYQAIEIIKSELPLKPEEREARIKLLEAQLKQLKAQQ